MEHETSQFGDQYDKGHRGKLVNVFLLQNIKL